MRDLECLVTTTAVLNNLNNLKNTAKRRENWASCGHTDMSDIPSVLMCERPRVWGPFVVEAMTMIQTGRLISPFVAWFGMYVQLERGAEALALVSPFGICTRAGRLAWSCFPSHCGSVSLVRQPTPYNLLPPSRLKARCKSALLSWKLLCYAVT